MGLEWNWISNSFSNFLILSSSKRPGSTSSNLLAARVADGSAPSPLSFESILQTPPPSTSDISSRIPSSTATVFSSASQPVPTALQSTTLTSSTFSPSGLSTLSSGFSTTSWTRAYGFSAASSTTETSSQTINSSSPTRHVTKVAGGLTSRATTAATASHSTKSNSLAHTTLAKATSTRVPVSVSNSPSSSSVPSNPGGSLTGKSHTAIIVGTTLAAFALLGLLLFLSFCLHRRRKHRRFLERDHEKLTQLQQQQTPQPRPHLLRSPSSWPSRLSSYVGQSNFPPRRIHQDSRRSSPLSSMLAFGSPTPQSSPPRRQLEHGPVTYTPPDEDRDENRRIFKGKKSPRISQHSPLPPAGPLPVIDENKPSGLPIADQFLRPPTVHVARHSSGRARGGHHSRSVSGASSYYRPASAHSNPFYAGRSSDDVFTHSSVSSPNWQPVSGHRSPPQQYPASSRYSVEGSITTTFADSSAESLDESRSRRYSDPFDMDQESIRTREE